MAIGAKITSSGGTVTSVTASAPIASSGGNTPNISLTGIVSGTYGGTGVNNGASTLTLGGNLVTSGAYASTFTMTALTSVTFPTSGTLATTSQIPAGAALTESNDTNVTLTLGGSASTALVNAASITAGWTGTLSGTRGGTGVNNGASTITLGGSLTTSGAFTTTLTSTGTTSVTLPTSGTLATTSQIPSSGSPLALNSGGTAANLTASNGGIFYSTGLAGAILAGTATAGQLLTSGASTTPAWTTSTYPATNAANTLLYASSANTMAALATANSSVLITSGSGVPSLATTLPASLTIPTATVTGEFTGQINSSGGSAWQLQDAAGGSGGQGAFYFSRNSSTVGSIQTTNVATIYATTSDSRLKDNVKPLVSMGALIDSLNPVTYDWNHVKENTHGVGFIAQEVYKVLPEAVSPGDNDPSKHPGDEGYKQWCGDWSKMIPYMVAELKQLRLRVAHLESREKSEEIQ
jgi:hypothetical protein